MKSSNSRWAKLMSIGVFGAMLLGIGAGPAAAMTTCRPGYLEVGPGLCINQVANPVATFTYAMYVCRFHHGRVATYGDLFYLHFYRPSLSIAYNPNGKWLGPELSADDQALCGNANVTFPGDLDVWNFEGACSKWDSRQYWCAHDLD